MLMEQADGTLLEFWVSQKHCVCSDLATSECLENKRPSGTLGCWLALPAALHPVRPHQPASSWDACPTQAVEGIEEGL